jgi:hypothetical protein
LVEASIILSLDNIMEITKSAWMKINDIYFHIARARMEGAKYASSSDISLAKIMDNIYYLHSNKWYHYHDDGTITQLLTDNYNKVKHKFTLPIYGFYMLSELSMRIIEYDSEETNKRFVKRGRCIENYNKNNEIKLVLTKIIFQVLEEEHINTLIQYIGIQYIPDTLKIFRENNIYLYTSNKYYDISSSYEYLVDNYPDRTYILLYILCSDRKPNIKILNYIINEFKLYSVVI